LDDLVNVSRKWKAGFSKIIQNACIRRHAMTKEHRSCDVDKLGEPLWWKHNPEDLLILLQLRDRLGQKQLEGLLEALDAREDQFNPEVVEALGAPRQLPLNDAVQLLDMLAEAYEEWNAQYGEAGLDSRETLATFWLLLDISRARVAEILRTTPNNVSKIKGSAQRKVRER
jgi:hypothetical protein